MNTYHLHESGSLHLSNRLSHLLEDLFDTLLPGLLHFLPVLLHLLQTLPAKTIEQATEDQTNFQYISNHCLLVLSP